MAAPATYIRTIHSSLTSASAHHSHHSSSAWASASASAQYHLNHGHHNHHPNHLHTLSAPTSLSSLSLASPSSGTPPPPPGLVTGGHPLPYHHHQHSQHLQSPRAAHNQVNYNAQGLMHTPSISTHNAHMYTHHLRDLTHPASQHHRAAGAQGPSALSSNQYDGAVLPTHDSHASAHAQGTMGAGAPRRNPPSPPPNTRRRSSSVRMPPSYRFDPFGDVDEPSALSLGGAGASGGAAGFASSGGGGGGGVSLFGSSPSVTASGPVASQAALPSEAPEAPAPAQARAAEEVDAAEQDQEQEDDIASLAPYVQPYTIQIPPAAPLEIEQYTTQPSSPSLSPSLSHSLPPPPLPRTPSPAARSLPPSTSTSTSRAPSPTPTASLVPKLPANTSALGLTYAPSTPSYQQAFNAFPAPRPNLSKIVAGILLNRVHAPKPMRRRGGYVGGGYMGGNGQGGEMGRGQAQGQGRGYVKSCLSSVVSVEC